MSQSTIRLRKEGMAG